MPNPVTDDGKELPADDLVPQPWNGLNGKVWVPDSGSGKLGLVVYLHGQINDGSLGANLMLADDATLKKDAWAMNLGNLAGKLIAGGKIKPIVVAAPSDKKADQGGGNLWKTLDLGAFVDQVVQKVRADDQIEIDLNQVALVGWSGAGCWMKCGLDKVAHQGGKFTAGGGSHTLAVLGLADTWVDGAYSRSIEAGLGAKQDLKGKPLPSPVEAADPDAFELYWDDGDEEDPPTRTVAKLALNSKSVARHWGDIVAAKGAFKKEHPDHGKMPLLWSWYGLQRYFHK